MVSPLRVYTFKEWCELRGISSSTGWRVLRDGKITVTRLSERRIGIREDHDREYLERCIRRGGPSHPRNKPKPAADVTATAPDDA